MKELEALVARRRNSGGSSSSIVSSKVSLCVTTRVYMPTLELAAFASGNFQDGQGSSVCSRDDERL